MRKEDVLPCVGCGWMCCDKEDMLCASCQGKDEEGMLHVPDEIYYKMKEKKPKKKYCFLKRLFNGG